MHTVNVVDFAEVGALPAIGQIMKNVAHWTVKLHNVFCFLQFICTCIMQKYFVMLHLLLPFYLFDVYAFPDSIISGAQCSDLVVTVQIL